MALQRNKAFTLRGGLSDDDFPPREITLREMHAIGRVAWEKWGPMIADYRLRDLIALAYVEGLYHGAMIAKRNPEVVGD